MKRALITGVTGFIGSHLAEYLLKEGVEVYGIVLWRSKIDNIEHITNNMQLINADIRDGHSLERLDG